MKKPKLKHKKHSLYSLVEEAVNKGYDWGYARAFKYVDDPSLQHIKEQIVYYIMLELCDTVDFGSEDEEEV